MLVVIGASAGGPPALVRVLSDLPAAFPACVAVVQHIRPDFPSRLPEVLSRACALPVLEAKSSLVIEPGAVYVAPPNRHLSISAPRRIVLRSTPPVNYVRPSVDVLFQSAALWKGKVIAAVLTGTGRDGAEGIRAIHRSGGLTIAQRPAACSGMPEAAIATGCVQMVLPLEQIGPAIVEAVSALARGEAA
ncbi:MAG: hypothetical protein KatS3mg024_0005 [Armatimonadota bacterium]|nr:MAG: hypothetical protein KatS3mg024_0005 [Armatimonadota bacterium]